MLRTPSSLTRQLVAVLAITLGLTAIAAAQEPADSTNSAARPTTSAERRVRDAVLGRFRVLPVQNGIVLVPLSRIEGVDNVELREGTIAINGHVATGGEVRQRLGRDAEAVLELSYLELADQQRILLPREGGGRQDTPSAASEPVEPPTPPEVPAFPVPFEPDRTFRRETDARIRIGGDIVVNEDEQVNSAVVAVGGSITINGRVRDDVVSIGGNVRLGPRADVRGDITVVGGTFVRDPGARVRGKVNEVAFSFPSIRIRPGWDFHALPWFGAGSWRVFRLFGSMLRVALFTLLATLFLLLAPRAVQRVEVAVRTQPWKSALTGLLAQLFFVPLLVLIVVVLAVSIIGIPLLVLVPFGILAFFVALLLGFTGAACGFARVAQHRFGSSAPSGFALLIVGLVMIWGLTVLGRIVGLGGGPLAVMGTLLVFSGLVVEYTAWTVGLGGALLTSFGRYGALPVTVPPVPPVALEPLGTEVPPVPPDSDFRDL